MALALNPDLPKDILSTLIVADISPLRGRLSGEFRKYLDGMIKLEKEGTASTKKEAFEALEEIEEVRYPFTFPTLCYTPSLGEVSFRDRILQSDTSS